MMSFLKWRLVNTPNRNLVALFSLLFVSFLGSVSPVFPQDPTREHLSKVEIATGITGLSALLSQNTNATIEQRADDWAQNLSFGFLPNHGQVPDAEGKPASEVLFSANVRGAQVYVTTSGMSHYFLKRTNATAKKWRPKNAAISEKEFEWRRIDLNLTGASILPDRIKLDEPLTDLGYTNYYRDHCPDGVVGVAAYGKITVTDIYPGIDWVVLSRAGEPVHHDFVVRPGADPSQIRMEYKGADVIEVSDDGRSLRIRTDLGDLQEGALYSYQGDKSNAIEGRFNVEGNSVRFEIGEYDHDLPLTIDPPLVWSTYYGGSNFDGPRSIVCDNANNFVYVVGYTYSTNMPTQNAGGGSFYQGLLADSVLIDGFIWKFTQTGVRLWATYYGGLGDESHADAAIDQFQNLYVCGHTTASNWPTFFLPGAFNDPTYGGGQSDATIMKFNSLGVRQWASYFGGNLADWATSITVDATGTVYMTGYTASPDLPVQNPGGGAYFQSTIASYEDAFIAKFSPLGVLQWSTFYGGPGNEEAFGIAVSANSIYITGMTQSAALPWFYPGGGKYIDSTLVGSQDGFVARFTIGGVQTWATYVGGDSTDWADDVVIDGSGNAFVVGYTESTNFPTLNPGGTTYYQPAGGGGLDIAISKFNSADSLVWSTYYGGSDIDFLLGAPGKSICLDQQGRLYVTGMTGSTDLPVFNPGGSFYQGTALGGPRDALIAQFSNSGTMLWSTYWGSSNPDFGSSMSIGNGGCVFATGESVDSANLFLMNPLMGAYYQPVCGGLDDGYIAKFCQPTGACCIDFNCVGANSQAECTSMGGSTFYPNQSCSTTVCSINCNICGTKYNDLNKNGAQDGGEPPLPGWTIQLYYWNGPLYASTTTDSLGNYCFNDIPCGTWTVTEQLQPNWVQTFPSPNVHNITLNTGSTQNNVNFGNSNCVADTCCVKPAAGMIAWYPFDESTPGVANDIAAKTRDGWHYDGQFAHADGIVGGAIALDSSRYVRVFDDPFAQIDSGDFSIDVWIKPSSFESDCLNYPYKPCAAIPIIDNRHQVTGNTGDDGIMFYLKRSSMTQARLGLAMNIFPNHPDTFETVTAPVILNAWQHVAVTISRSTGSPIGVFYYNGDSVGSFIPIPGRVYSTAAPGSVLDIGHGPTSSSYGAGGSCNYSERRFVGLLDELEIWRRWLSTTEISRLYAAGSRGKCKISCAIPSSVVLCRTATTVTMNLTVCNQTPNTSIAKYSFAPLASGSGCNFNATGITFSPTNGVITLLPGQCTQIPVTLSRPVGFVPGSVACFCVTVQDTLTKAMSTCCSKLVASNGLCVTLNDPFDVTTLATGQARAFGFTVKNETDSLVAFDYTLRAEGNGEASDPTALALNGLPPGSPIVGSVMLPPWSEAVVSGDAVLTAYRPLDLESVLLEADVDGDGSTEPLGTVLIQPVSYPDCNANSIDDALDIQFGTSLDANGNGFPDECEVPLSDPAGCYICGDANSSGSVSISDVVFLINYIFAGGAAPSPVARGDANCSGNVNISDAVFLVNFIFSGGPKPCAACP